MFQELKLRATILAKIREFFLTRNVLEVETPLLYPSSATDPYIESFSTTYRNQTLYLQTSPEFPMKRMLCAGSSDIYEISKVFRKDESGKKHNPEFTLLEWYRVGFDHHQLIQDVDELLQFILQTKPADKISYQQIFIDNVNLDPFVANINELQNCAAQHNLQLPEKTDKDDLLNLLLTHLIEPNVGTEKPIFIYDYPASQAALAKIRHDTPSVAERFEVYFQGLELANGYHELTDANEQRRRFESDNKKRQSLNLPTVAIDEKLLSAMADLGLPDCAGVALGVDRLIMLAAGTNDIREIIAIMD